MRTIILCIFALFLGIVSKAQSTSASLNIILTDVQSVTFNTVALSEVTSSSQEQSKNGTLQVLSQSTSQIKKINSKNSEYERLYKEFYSGTTASSTKAIYGMAVNSTSLPKPIKSYTASNLVIYQIDPR